MMGKEWMVMKVTSPSILLTLKEWKLDILEKEWRD